MGNQLVTENHTKEKEISIQWAAWNQLKEKYPDFNLPEKDALTTEEWGNFFLESIDNCHKLTMESSPFLEEVELTYEENEKYWKPFLEANMEILGNYKELLWILSSRKIKYFKANFMNLSEKICYSDEMKKYLDQEVVDDKQSITFDFPDLLLKNANLGNMAEVLQKTASFTDKLKDLTATIKTKEPELEDDEENFEEDFEPLKDYTDKFDFIDYCLQNIAKVKTFNEIKNLDLKDIGSPKNHKIKYVNWNKLFKEMSQGDIELVNFVSKCFAAKPEIVSKYNSRLVACFIGQNIGAMVDIMEEFLGEVIFNGSTPTPKEKEEKNSWLWIWLDYYLQQIETLNSFNSLKDIKLGVCPENHKIKYTNIVRFIKDLMANKINFVNGWKPQLKSDLWTLFVDFNFGKVLTILDSLIADYYKYIEMTRVPPRNNFSLYDVIYCGPKPDCPLLYEDPIVHDGPQMNRESQEEYQWNEYQRQWSRYQEQMSHYQRQWDQYSNKKNRVNNMF